MIDHEALQRAFGEYARALLGPYDIGRVLYRLTDHVVEVLDVDGAGVSLAGDDGLAFVTATDERTMRVEEHQAEIAEGPCHEAFDSLAPVTCDDLAADGRWKGFTPLAVEQGYGAIAGLPMPARDRAIGALDIYRDHPHAWSDEELHVAQLLADMAAGYVINARQLHETRELSEQLQRALDSRVVIEQAKGIIAAKNDVDVADAFERLRSHARSERRSLHEVAREVVERDLVL